MELFTISDIFVGHSLKEGYVMGPMDKPYLFATSGCLAVGCPSGIIATVEAINTSSGPNLPTFLGA